jgi:hypothetical protein
VIAKTTRFVHTTTFIHTAGLYTLYVRTHIHCNINSPNPEILTALEQKISEDRLAKYKGSAQILIEHLDFPYLCRKVDKRIVDQLKRDFKGEGCNSNQLINWIPAVISDSVLQEGLEKLLTSAKSFKITSKDKLPKLQLVLSIRLECLHRQHRILMAKEFLDTSNR